MNIKEQVRETPVVAKTDVLVVGGGPAGIIAAIAAARKGAKTILVEKNAFPGGNAGLGLPFLGFYRDNQKRIVGGIPWELVERLKKAKASPGPWFTDPTAKYKDSMVVFDLPLFRTVVDRMLAESGVKTLLYTLAVAPIVKNGTVKGIIIESKAGRQAILSKLTIDASGDGDIAVRAGAPFEKGHPQSGLLQPPTLLFEVFDVDMDALLADVAKHSADYDIPDRKVAARYPAEYRKGACMAICGLEKICRKAHARGDYDVENPYVIFVCLPQKGTILVNMAKVKLVDGTDNRDLSRAESKGIENIWKVMSFLKKYIKGFKKAKVGWIANSIGIRETRRITGEYTLNENDMAARVKFEDRIGLGSRYIDIHNPKPGFQEPFGPAVVVQTPKPGFQKPFGPAVVVQTFPDGYYLPFRCLKPKKINNLLVAGRCISVSHAAYGSTRVMAQCMATGQAAGTAAALAVKENIPLQKLDIKHLQAALRRNGAIID